MGEQITAGVVIFIVTALLGFVLGQFVAKRKVLCTMDYQILRDSIVAEKV